MPRRPILRERVRSGVADYIKEQIFEGAIRAGERVPQDDVARVLGVSNTPVREAIIALESEGIVEIKPHRGAFVSRFDRHRVRDNYELFALLYGWAIRRAVIQITPDHRRELLRIASRLRAVDEPGDVRPIMVEFVDALGRTCDSPAWRHLVDAVPDLLPSDSYYKVVPGMSDAATKWMGEIASAIERGDGETAAAAAEQMLQEHGEALIAEFARRGLFDDDGS